MKRQIMVVVAHPEYGRQVRHMDREVTALRLRGVFIPDPEHPLGGWVGDMVLYRRVNLRKDYVPRWHRSGVRPQYEFTKERPS